MWDLWTSNISLAHEFYVHDYLFCFYLIFLIENKVSRDVRKPDFCICENKDADQLRGNREADQRLCFRYLDSTFPLLSKSKFSRL